MSVSGDAAGTAEILIYAQYQGFIGAAEGAAMVPACYLRSVLLLDHTSTYRGNAVFVVNTMKADRLFPSVIAFSGASAVYVNVAGLTATGETPVSGAGVAGEDDADVFDVVDIVKVGGQTLAAHGAAATTVPVVVGARASASDPADVDANDAVLLSTTLGSRLRVQSGGVAAHGAAVSGNPVLVGAKATAAEPSAVDEADVADLSVTLAGRLRVNAIGNTADDAAADALGPVKIGAVADAAVSAVSDADQVHLVTDLYRRLRSLPEGATADDAADSAALNPVKVGGIAASHLTPDAADSGDIVHLSMDLYRRVRVLPEGAISDGTAEDATKPVKIAGIAADTTTMLASAVDAGDIATYMTDLNRRTYTHPQGATADGSANVANEYPVKACGVAYTPTGLAASDVDAADIAHLALDLEHRLYVHPMGYVADDAANNTDDLPVKVGAVADQVVAAVSDGDMVHLTTDLSRQLRVVSAAYDSVAAADRASVNTIADDRDEAAQTWGDVTNDATDPDYFPSSSGYEVGNRTWLTLHIRMRDGVITWETSNDGSNWEDTTTMLIDRNLGYGGFASYSEADAATIDWMLEVRCGARYCRAKWDPNNATSVIQIYAMARVS